MGKNENIYKKLADEKGLCIGYASAQGEFAPKFLHYIVLRADWLQLVPRTLSRARSVGGGRIPVKRPLESLVPRLKIGGSLYTSTRK